MDDFLISSPIDGNVYLVVAHLYMSLFNCFSSIFTVVVMRLDTIKNGNGAICESFDGRRSSGLDGFSKSDVKVVFVIGPTFLLQTKIC